MLLSHPIAQQSGTKANPAWPLQNLVSACFAFRCLSCTATEVTIVAKMIKRPCWWDAYIPGCRGALFPAKLLGEGETDVGILTTERRLRRPSPENIEGAVSSLLDENGVLVLATMLQDATNRGDKDLWCPETSEYQVHLEPYVQILDTAVNKAPLGRTVVKKPYPRKFAKIFQPQL